MKNVNKNEVVIFEGKKFREILTYNQFALERATNKEFKESFIDYNDYQSKTESQVIIVDGLPTIAEAI